MIKIILTIILALSGFAFSQGASGLGSSRMGLDTNTGNALNAKEQINWYVACKVLKRLPNGLVIKISDAKSAIIMFYPKKLKVGQYASAWVIKAPKKISYKDDQGKTSMIHLYGFTQYRYIKTNISRRNQKKAN